MKRYRFLNFFLVLALLVTAGTLASCHNGDEPVRLEPVETHSLYDETVISTVVTDGFTI